LSNTELKSAVWLMEMHWCSAPCLL